MPSGNRGYARSSCKTSLCDEVQLFRHASRVAHQSKIGPAEVRNVKEPIMSHFDAYRDSFPNARLTRSKTGVLEVALHTNGGTLAFNGYTHEQFVDLFHAIGSDRDNRVVILTGQRQCVHGDNQS